MMNKNGKAIRVTMIVIVMIVVFYFTNIFDLMRPGVDKVINSTEEAASKVTVKGKDVVSGVKTVSSDVQNMTSQIKIKNPYP